MTPITGAATERGSPTAVGASSVPYERHAMGSAMGHERCFRDSAGVEWEVYDEAGGSIGWALDWDYPVQRHNPGLLFVSRTERRRLWPCPGGWGTLRDEELEELCQKARALG